MDDPGSKRSESFRQPASKWKVGSDQKAELRRSFCHNWRRQLSFASPHSDGRQISRFASRKFTSFRGES